MKTLFASSIAFVGIMAAPAVAATGDNIVAVTRPAIKTPDAAGGAAFLQTEIAIGVEAGAPCYKAVTHDDIATIVNAARLEQLLSDNTTITDAMASMGGQYGSARYLALLFVGKAETTYVIAGTMLDARSARRIASTQHTFERIEQLAGGHPVRAMFASLASKLPCSLEIAGTRQIDLDRIADATDTAFAPNVAMMQALAPLALGGEPRFSGHATQTDTITTPTLAISGDAGAVTATGTWTAVVDAPVIKMTSPGADVSATRAPYTLKFEGKDISGTYNRSTGSAHFALEFLDQGTASAGAGQATVTLKGPLAGLMDLSKAMIEVADTLAPGAGQQAKAVAEAEARKELGTAIDIDSPTNTVPLPFPNQLDLVYFRLNFDVNLREDDEKRVAAGDSLGSYDYAIKIKRESR